MGAPGSNPYTVTLPYVFTTACGWTAAAEERAQDPEYARLKHRCATLKVENARLRSELEALINAP